MPRLSIGFTISMFLSQDKDMTIRRRATYTLPQFSQIHGIGAESLTLAGISANPEIRAWEEIRMYPWFKNAYFKCIDFSDPNYDIYHAPRTTIGSVKIPKKVRKQAGDKALSGHEINMYAIKI